MALNNAAALSLCIAVFVVENAAGAPSNPSPSPPPAASTVRTPWPAELPCHHPQWFSYSGPKMDLRWLGADGTPLWTVRAEQLEKGAVRLDRKIPVDKLDRLWVERPSDFTPTFSVSCARPEDPVGVSWSLCKGGPCAKEPSAKFGVVASYAAPQVKLHDPCARWISNCGNNDCLEKNDCKGKVCRISHLLGPQSDPQTQRAAANELAHDLADAMREFFVQACPPERCSPRVDTARWAVDHFLATDVLTVERLEVKKPEQKIGSKEHSLLYKGKVLNEDTTLEFHILAAKPSPECSVQLSVRDTLVFSYSSAGRITFLGPEGEIEFVTDEWKRHFQLESSMINFRPR